MTDQVEDENIEGEEAEGEDEEEDEDPLAHLPEQVVQRVEKLRYLNDQRLDIMQEYLKERAELEQKYLKTLKPLYDERASILKGDQDETIAAAAEQRQNDSENADESRERIVGIPHFWVTVMSEEETIGEQLTEPDVDCLATLENIEYEDFADGKGFVLFFHFAENDYFHDKVLVKKYEVPNLLLSDEPMLKNVEGCKIQWKEGKCLTHRTVKKKQRGKGKNAGQVRTITKEEKIDSFFNWFDPPPMPKMNEVDEAEADELEEFFDSDYEIAQAFRSNVIPQAVMWFTGEVIVI